MIDTKLTVIPIIVPDQSSLKSVNFFLVNHGTSLSLIDAGLNHQECWKGLNDSLRKNGYSIKDITEIILTHHHIDHVGLVNRITAENPIPVYAHPDSIPRLKRDKDFLEMRIEFYSRLYHEMGCGERGNQQVIYLKQAIERNKQNAIQTDVIGIAGDQLLNFQVVKVPGHAPDQLAYYDEPSGWLFGGDLLIEHISSNALVEPDRNGKKLSTLIQHINSMKRCLELDAELVFSGHGKMIEKPNELILKRLERIDAKAERLIHLIKSGSTTGNEIAKAYYKNTYNEQFSLVMSEIIGQLDYLEMQGKVKKEWVKEVWHYSIVNEHD